MSWLRAVTWPSVSVGKASADRSRGAVLFKLVTECVQVSWWCARLFKRPSGFMPFASAF